MKLFLAFIVVVSACGSANRYTVKVTMQPTNLQGKQWDKISDGPDPYVIVNGNEYKSDTCEDTFECKIPITAQMDGNYRVKIEVWDDDSFGKDDFVGTVECGAGDFSCETNTKSAKVRVFTR